MELRRPSSYVPYAWALGYVVVFGVAFFTISWPLNDTYAHLVKPAMLPWRDAVADAFTRGVEYRPFFTLAIKLTYEMVGPSLRFYQGLVLMQFAALLALVVWLCRPMGWPRALAACAAVSCVCGLHSSRILFGFWPLNHHSGVMVLVLAMIALACRPATRRIDWVFGPLALSAMFGLELGTLCIPLSIVLWWFRAPGIGRRGVVWVLAAAVIYAGIRLTFGEHTEELAIYADSGFMFRALDANELKQRFGATPWVFWAYNVLATFLTVVASEPRDGIYQFVESLLAHDMETWQWFHVGLSLLTSLIIMGGLIRLVLRRRAGAPLHERDRLLVVIGCSLLLFGSCLGFLYTRDRIGLSGGVGYALLLYVALVSWLEDAPARRWARGAVTCAVTLVIAAWGVRSAETYFQLRDTAWDYYHEWTTRFDELGGLARGETELLTTMRTRALEKLPEDPRLDPAWTYSIFERRFHRVHE